MIENFEENYNDALILRDWLVFRDANLLYKGKVRLNIGKWKDGRKKRLLVILKDLFDLNMANARPQLEQIYTDLLPGLMDKSYTLIKNSVLSSVFLKDNLIVKAFPKIIRNNNQIREDVISRNLYNKGFNVPERFEPFETEFYTCYPMEKLPFTLVDLLESKGSGCINFVYKIIKTAIPILKVLHTEFKSLYVDFSIANLALKNDIVYMLDFGSMHPTNFSATPMAKTLRYCSVDAFNGNPVNEWDDLQSLGFVLLEAYFGFEKSPLNETPSEKSKLDVIDNAEKGIYGKFFQEYFQIACTMDCDNYQNILDLCI
jgi:hypothetical protein